jgi:histidine triad (HIT) family protein
MTCIFCQIITGEIPGTILHHDDLVTAFRDIHPLSSTHILIVPNRHISSVNDLEPADATLVGHMLLIAKELAVQEGVADTGYRLIFTTYTSLPASVPVSHWHNEHLPEC